MCSCSRIEYNPAKILYKAVTSIIKCTDFRNIHVKNEILVKVMLGDRFKSKDAVHLAAQDAKDFRWQPMM